MTFRKTLIIGHGITLLLAAATAAVAVVALQVTTRDVGRSSRQLADELEAVQHLRVGAEHVAAASRGYLLGGEREDRERFESACNTLDRELEVFRAQPLAPAAYVEVAAAEVAARAYERDAARAGQLRATAHDFTAIVPYFESTLKPSHDEFEARVAALTEHEREAFELALRDAEATSHLAELALIAAAIAAIALGAIALARTARRLDAGYTQIETARAAATAAVAARDELVAVVSHDLRTPLQTVVLGASVLEQTADDERVRRHVHRVSNAAARMRRMIDTLLDTVRLDAGTFVLHDAPCGVPALVDDTVEQFEPRAAEQAIRLRVEHDATEVRADHDRIVEVLSNLLDNAFKHTPRGGEIRVTAAATDDAVRFTVADTGAGIAPADAAHVFDRYWQGDDVARSRGVGLGLYICKRLIEAHHGAIGVASTPGAGTEFWFTLPRVAQAPAPA